MADPIADPRDLYLTRVAAGLRLPPDVTRDVVEELAGHLADATEALQAEGLDPAMAEREAMARLGNPDALSDEIRHAHQTRRRALVAAGYGVLAGLNGAFWAYLFAVSLLTLSAMAGFGVLSVIVRAIGVSVSGWETWSAIITTGVSLFAVGYAGSRLISVVAARSYRRTTDIARPVAVIGWVTIASITIFWLRIAQDPATVAALVLVPFAFAIGVLLPVDLRIGAQAGRIRLSTRAVLGLLGVLTVGWVAVGIVTIRLNPEPGNEGRVAYTVYPMATQPQVPAATEFGAYTIGWPTLSLTFDPPSQSTAWRDLRAEAWPALDVVNGWGGGIDPAAAGPILTAPMVERGSGVVEASLELPATKARTFYAALVSGIAPDGIRYVVAGPDGPGLSPPWVGTAWEWFTAP